MKILLAAVDEPLAGAWQRHCSDLPDVTIHRGSLLDLAVDAVVSPANSSGFAKPNRPVGHARDLGGDMGAKALCD